MTTTSESTTHVRARHQRPPGSAHAPSRPSFANALRQRGLLAKAMLPESMASAWSGASSAWLAVSSIYEAHLRRVLMEQAQEILRGDAPG